MTVLNCSVFQMLPSDSHWVNVTVGYFLWTYDCKKSNCTIWQYGKNSSVHRLFMILLSFPSIHTVLYSHVPLIELFFHSCRWWSRSQYFLQHDFTILSPHTIFSSISWVPSHGSDFGPPCRFINVEYQQSTACCFGLMSPNVVVQCFLFMLGVQTFN